ncbi:hypothetical protein V7S43_018338 [Phytophthora oleae]|uniref:Uncharacterized protein n=1 Tax=Phytophthora oleae TaxID=2107226 RepID=A0ABD3EUU1_9STRA
MLDGYRQTLLGRALADALQDLEKEGGGDDALEVDGDLLYSLFDEAMQLELRDRRGKDQENAVRTSTHESLKLTGQITAFNRFMDDWSVLARARPQDIRLNHGVADLHLPQVQEGGQVAMRLKLRKKA